MVFDSRWMKNLPDVAIQHELSKWLREMKGLNRLLFINRHGVVVENRLSASVKLIVKRPKGTLVTYSGAFFLQHSSFRRAMSLWLLSANALSLKRGAGVPCFSCLNGVKRYLRLRVDGTWAVSDVCLINP